MKDEQKLLQAFGDTIRHLRDHQGLTQQALADLSGVDRAYISQLELGESTPSIIVVFKLSETLKVKPGEILDQTDRRSRDHGKRK